MAYKKKTGTVTSLDGLFDAVDLFLRNTLGWSLEHSGTEMGQPFRIYHSTGESGAYNIYIGMYRYYYNTLLCGLQFAAYTGVNTSAGFDDQPGSFGQVNCLCCQFRDYPNLPAVDDGTAIYYWLFGDKDFLLVILRVGAKYQRAYVGLYHPFFSSLAYPCCVLGACEGTVLAYCCESSMWCTCTGGLPLLRCLHLVKIVRESWLRNPDDTGWIGCSAQGTCACYQCCYVDLITTCWGLGYRVAGCGSSSRSHGLVLYPIYVVTGDNKTLGELKYVYWARPDKIQVPSETVVYVAGDPYLIFRSFTTNDLFYLAVRNYED